MSKKEVKPVKAEQISNYYKESRGLEQCLIDE
ncbi:TrwG protein, partial [Bartonella sp. F2]|nr:TrwG protein [Bartonella sp. F02]